MDTETALNFLESHQCISEKSEQGDIDRFDEVRQFFVENPDPRCIPLFLGVFGDHMGWGVFQLCDEVFECYSREQLAPHLKSALKSENKGTRWWAAHWAMESPAEEFRDELLGLLASQADTDAHYFVISALGELLQEKEDPTLRDALRARQQQESDKERLELLADILDGNTD